MGTPRICSVETAFLAVSNPLVKIQKFLELIKYHFFFNDLLDLLRLEFCSNYYGFFDES